MKVNNSTQSIDPIWKTLVDSVDVYFPKGSRSTFDN